jgi:hypothetical protein
LFVAADRTAFAKRYLLNHELVLTRKLSERCDLIAELVGLSSGSKTYSSGERQVIFIGKLTLRKCRDIVAYESKYVPARL